ncbi:TetR/AcrR family transcriptional regulator [Pseudomonas gingeri]|uniref:TetR/AcrR family transcriptional regulator n=1 Tax=Pseudomonas gingeri TaxID=117681 RepID=A0A7Y8CLT2_9PSED|nr:TetR/AcrR family transcriptional regulator [Pseudomonas gingeri]NWA02688.1 TetR/AcrR family transcriptional regulator [Pseudomonas gingeri]NWA12138.1 TetR/AcrR family transcriptional regulator [Pseudomonas gingeri]NWA57455.1 TetR/AcrR family transcriptional regulator [Pseudomonas gingeri]NWA93798.1 TetR/AcrR family transcriptional regulator [Pseudomonas gingeri]NWB03270.1 TetR/AcrR family transcriptional regulator [Pseudomonas gingeri]
MKKPEPAPGSRKEALTSLAVDLLQDRGFTALGLRDLAEAACIKAASLYSHFESKNALVLQAMQLYNRHNRDNLAALDHRATANIRLQDYVQLFIHTLENDSRLCLGLMLAVERNALSAEIMEQVRIFARQNTQWIADTWDRGRQDGSIDSVLTGTVAAPIIFGAAEGMMPFALLQQDPTVTFNQHLGQLLAALGVHRDND